MIHNRIKGLFHIHATTLVLVQTLLFWVLLQAFRDLSPSFGEPSTAGYAACNLAGILGSVLYLFKADSSRLNLMVLGPLKNLRISLRQTSFITIGMILLMFVTKDHTVSRFFIVSYAALVFLVNFASNQWGPRILSRLLFPDRHDSRTLLVGPARLVRRLNRWLHYTMPYGVQIAGIVSDAPLGSQICGFPILGETQDIERFLAEKSIDQVIVLEAPESPGVVSKIIRATDRAGARLLFFDDPLARNSAAVMRFSHLGENFFSIREEPLQNPVNRIAKRLFDIAVSLPVVVLVLPILILGVFICQRVSSPGAVLYRQVRSGTRRKPFEILKFRSMHESGENAAQQATANDSRIYAAGRFLRKTSLDEFPQFLNVLRGEMSIVGPRPHMIEHDAEFSKVMSKYHVRNYVKPGITGLAQVRGFRGEAKSDADIHNRALCDIEYIERWSMALDWIIIARTFLQIFRPPKTAY